MKHKIYVRQTINPKSRWMIWATFAIALERDQYIDSLRVKHPSWQISPTIGRKPKEGEE
jgi:hypothetical protein